MVRIELKLTLAFAAGAIATGAGALRFPALAWPAVAFGLVGAAYAGLGPRVFAKGPHGKHHPLALLILAPYLLIAWCVLAVLRFRAEAPYHEIRPDLFLGRRPLRARELPPGTSLVVDLTSEFPGVAPEGVAYVCLPTLDGSAPRDVDLVRRVIDRISAHSGVVYVHCAAGHGRSAAIVAGVLLREGRASTPVDALRQMRRQRAGVGLSQSQLALVNALALS